MGCTPFLIATSSLRADRNETDTRNDSEEKLQMSDICNQPMKKSLIITTQRFLARSKAKALIKIVITSNNQYKIRSIKYQANIKRLLFEA
jgi:hypothetical protein